MGPGNDSCDLPSNCFDPAPPVPSGGGTSFASSRITSPVFQLAPAQGAGYVKVAMLSPPN